MNSVLMHVYSVWINRKHEVPIELKYLRIPVNIVSSLYLYTIGSFLTGHQVSLQPFLKATMLMHEVPFEQGYNILSLNFQQNPSKKSLVAHS